MNVSPFAPQNNTWTCWHTYYWSHLQSCSLDDVIYGCCIVKWSSPSYKIMKIDVANFTKYQMSYIWFKVKNKCLHYLVCLVQSMKIDSSHFISNCLYIHPTWTTMAPVCFHALDWTNKTMDRFSGGFWGAMTIWAYTSMYMMAIIISGIKSISFLVWNTAIKWVFQVTSTVVVLAQGEY